MYYLGARVGSDFNGSGQVFEKFIKSSISLCATPKQADDVGPICCIQTLAA